MNKLQIIKRKKGMVELKCTEETYNLIEKLLTEYLNERQEMVKKAALKNIIPVMLNKFTRWLDGLTHEYKDVVAIVDKIDKIRNKRQNMSIKDLRIFCQNESIKDYWLEFLYEGHAKQSIVKMKKSANKKLYEEQLQALLKEIQYPTIRNKPYKKFTYLRRNSTNSDNYEEDFSSNQNVYYESAC